MSTTEVQTRNKLLQTMTSSYTDDSPAYRLCDVVNLTDFLRRVFPLEESGGFISFSSIDPGDGRRKTLLTRKSWADRVRRNVCFREIDGPVQVELPEICVGSRVFADASCPPSDDEILIP